MKAYSAVVVGEHPLTMRPKGRATGVAPPRWPWGSKIFIGVVFLSILLGGTGIIVASERVVLATGNGFEITSEELEELKVYMRDQRQFESTEAQHLKVAIQIHLFAEEARSLGIDGEETSKEEDNLSDLMRLSTTYVHYLLDNYQIDDLTIQSYYLAHPGRFEAASGSETKEGSGRPDDDQRGYIRNIILKAKKAEILESSFQGLKKKYDVRIPQRGTGGTQ